jgi:endonuclease V-like protein UPF0215 family
MGSILRLRNCYAGVDDGYFTKSWKRTIAVLAVHCTVNNTLCPCAVYTDYFTIDGLDATEVIARLTLKALEQYNIRLLLMDSVVYAGFNIADIDALHNMIGVPVAAIIWYPPNREAVERALKLHFSDWKIRLGLLEKVWGSMRSLACPKGKIYVAWRGISWWDLAEIICSLQIYTRHPEPLYTAHMLASSLSKRWLEVEERNS